MKIPDVIKLTARDLRNNSTKSEVILWKFIKCKLQNYKFLRQKPIYVYTGDSGLDRYIIADFYCHQKKLILEIDGNIHDTPEVLELDKHKELLLSKQDIKVLRIKNKEIFEDITNVLEKINLKLQ